MTTTPTTTTTTAPTAKALASAAARILAGGTYAPKAGSVAAAMLAANAGDHAVALPPKAYRAPVTLQADGSYRKTRANGTTRNVPTYPVGTAQRALAETYAEGIAAGATVATIAATFHVSVPTVRRVLHSLTLSIANGI